LYGIPFTAILIFICNIYIQIFQAVNKY